MHMGNRSSAVDVAQSLIPLIKESAEAGERLCELSPAVVAAFHEHNLWGMYVPVEMGGLGIGPLDGLQVLEAISYADGSSAWVLAIAFAAAVSMAYMPDEGVAKAFPSGKRIPVIAGSGRPDGNAIIVPGGFKLTGRWSYGSGIKHADYAMVGARIMDGDKPRLTAQGMPEIRLMIVPREKVAYVSDWDVLGLRATGSVDYAVEDLFVPEEFSYLITSQSGKRGKLFRLGYASLVPIGHAGWSLGLARRVLDELALFAQTKKIPGGIGISESFQQQFAHHEAALRAGRAFLMEVWEDIERMVAEERDLTTRQETLIRLSLNNITSVGVAIANFAYRAGGGTALRTGVLQRLCRDTLAGAQHLTSSPAALRECGRELAGLAPGHIWAAFSLIDIRPK
jgi:alkylation response protein AidB-like acyl-CoA dehydrogenase